MNLRDTPAADALRRAALAYAARGWQVLPLWWPVATGGCACGLPECDGAGKHPIRRLVPHGLLDATSRLQTVGDWWRSAPQANVGSGPASRAAWSSSTSTARPQARASRIGRLPHPLPGPLGPNRRRLARLPRAPGHHRGQLRRAPRRGPRRARRRRLRRGAAQLPHQRPPESPWVLWRDAPG